MDTIPTIVVLGGGISALSSCLALIENAEKSSPSSSSLPFRLVVIAEHFSPNTTSDIAGGFWLPYNAKHPKFNEWSTQTMDRLQSLLSQVAKQSPKGQLPPIVPGKLTDPLPSNPFGVYEAECLWFEHGDVAGNERKNWGHIVKDLRPLQIGSDACPVATLPSGAKEAWTFRSPLVQSTRYLAHTRQVLLSYGVQFFHHKVYSFQEVIKTYSPSLIINCIGLGSKELLDDYHIFPIRGVLLRLSPKANSALVGKVWLFDDDPAGVTYIIARPDGIFVGGTAQNDNWTTTTDSEEIREILNRAANIEPRIRDAKVVDWRVGLRPGRSEIRVEADRTTTSVPIVHNYGHGGSGWTVHWGCALEVVKLSQAALGQNKAKL